jgi:hypothetical protein
MPKPLRRTVMGVFNLSMKDALVWRNAFRPRRLIPNLSSSGPRCLFHTLPELNGVPFCEANSSFSGFGRQADRYIRKCPANSGEMASSRTAFAFFGAWSFPAHTRSGQLEQTSLQG